MSETEVEIEVEAFRWNFLIKGNVQGVGFRFFAQFIGQELNLMGWVRNLEDSNVEVEAQGALESLKKFELKLQQGPPLSEVEDVTTTETTPVEEEVSFEVRY